MAWLIVFWRWHLVQAFGLWLVLFWAEGFPNRFGIKEQKKLGTSILFLHVIFIFNFLTFFLLFWLFSFLGYFSTFRQFFLFPLFWHFLNHFWALSFSNSFEIFHHEFIKPSLLFLRLNNLLIKFLVLRFLLWTIKRSSSSKFFLKLIISYFPTDHNFSLWIIFGSPISFHSWFFEDNFRMEFALIPSMTFLAIHLFFTSTII